MLAGVALGSNLRSERGGREQNLHEAIRQVARLGQIVAVSKFYDTEPVGYLDQPRFLNGALLLESSLGPQELLAGLLAVELEMGRVRAGVPAKGPRVIDLDLLFVGALEVSTAELTLPHPAMAERSFVLRPLAEIAPEWVHPGTGLSVREMLARL